MLCGWYHVITACDNHVLFDYRQQQSRRRSRVRLRRRNSGGLQFSMGLLQYRSVSVKISPLIRDS